MNNLYNKGKYRCGEWARHLRPYLKKRGNRIFRHNVKMVVAEELGGTILPVHKKKNTPRIVVKITCRYYCGKITKTHRFCTMKDAEKAIRRPAVLSYFFLSHNKV